MRDSDLVRIHGYGGNASPFSNKTRYHAGFPNGPKGYAQYHHHLPVPHAPRDARIWLVCAGLSGSSVSFARVHTNDSTSVDVCVCLRVCVRSIISRAGTRPPSSAYSAQRASVLQTSWMQGESPPYTSRVSSSPPGTGRIRGRGMQSCSRTGKAFAIRM